MYITYRATCFLIVEISLIFHYNKQVAFRNRKKLIVLLRKIYISSRMRPRYLYIKKISNAYLKFLWLKLYFLSFDCSFVWFYRKWILFSLCKNIQTCSSVHDVVFQQVVCNSWILWRKLKITECHIVGLIRKLGLFWYHK